MNITNLSLVKRNIVAALLITSFVMPVTAAAKIISSPLTVGLVTQEYVGYRPGCSSQFGGTTTGTGTSSLLGGVSLEANDCITVTPESLSFMGALTLTVSSGDEIFANYSGFLTPTNYPSIFVFTDSVFKITGGTGNFLGATGGGKLLGGEDISTGRGLMQATGTISDFKKIKKDKDRQEARQANELAAGSSDLTFTDWSSGATSAGLDSAMSPHGQALGNYFYRDQNAQLFAVNGIPEAASLSLLGIGLASLVAVRRHRSRRMSSRIPATAR